MTSHMRQAAENLQNAGIDLFEDFHALPSAKVDVILSFADLAKYKKPANANGSRARYFFNAAKRAANRG